MLKVLMLRRSHRRQEGGAGRAGAQGRRIPDPGGGAGGRPSTEVEPGNAEQEEPLSMPRSRPSTTEKAAHEEAKQTLSADIEGLEAELEEIERSAPKPHAPETKKTDNVRGDTKMETINIRSLPKTRRAFDALSCRAADCHCGAGRCQNLPGPTAEHEGPEQSHHRRGIDHPRSVPGPDRREHVPLLQTAEPCARPLCQTARPVRPSRALCPRLCGRRCAGPSTN